MAVSRSFEDDDLGSPFLGDKALLEEIKMAV